jgi:hypothetical protein
MAMLGLQPFASTRSLPARVTSARYRVEVGAVEGGPGEELGAVLMPALSRYTTAEAAVVERVREGRSKAVDVRTYVPSIDAEPTARGVALSFTAEVTPNGTVRPEEVVEVVARIAGVDLMTFRCERLEIVLH